MSTPVPFAGFGLAFVLALALTTAPANAVDAPQEQLIAVCESCHGAKGAAPIVPSYPVIAGQYENFLVRSLKSYRSGERKNALMNGQAAALSDEDIKSLARYYSRQEGPLYTPAVGQ